ncbi:MAG: 50S ribosomal protein L13 [Deltaproteobacteria bacterium]|jgi:large subunit ribosomal protein L13|nr:50S ribosomal protein L13 [Deltaproteobacteria bacterium]
MRTFFQTKEAALKNRKWILIDAENKIVGRVASEVAAILRGKNNPAFTPHNDDGDFVIVVNAAKIKFSGNKEKDKLYHVHSGYVSGLRTDTVSDLRQQKPEEIMKRAVWGMLPHTALGRRQLKKLKIFAGAEHIHAAQTPELTSSL